MGVRLVLLYLPGEFDGVQILTRPANVLDDLGRDLAGDLRNERGPVVTLADDALGDLGRLGAGARRRRRIPLP